MSEPLLIARSRPLDAYHTSHYPEVQKVILALFVELRSHGCFHHVSQKKALKHLKLVALDLYVVAMTPWTEFISYSRTKSDYSPGTWRHRLLLSYRMMIRVVNSLELLGYVRTFPGFYDRERGIGFQTRMQATEKFLSLIEKKRVTRNMIRRIEGPLLVLRDKNKNCVDFIETPETQQMRKFLSSYNRFLKDFSIVVDQKEEEIAEILIRKKKINVNFDCIAMHRVFNGDFESGGRFYGAWWQSIPRELRPFIQIDGQITSELDYSSQHPLMLYAENGDEYYWLKGVDDDPYALKGISDSERELVKVIALVVINASDRKKAINAIRREIINGRWNLPKDNAFINSRIDAFLEKHDKIRHHAFSGVGLKLQRKDSRITEYILSDMKAKGIPVLTVHDSFITSNSFLHLVYSAMKEAYRMEGISSIPKIKLTPGVGSDTGQESFKALQLLMDRDHRQIKNEAEGISWIEEHYGAFDS